MKKLFYAIILFFLLISCDSFFEQDRANIIRTGSPLEIRTNSAFIEGLLLDISDQNDEEILAYGHVWGQSANPTTADAFTDFFDSDRPTTFLSFLPDLQQEVTYFVRAYLTTEQGTFYGKEISFTPGQVTTISVLDIGVNQASAEGSVSESAGNVQSFGHCWSMNNLPTIEDNRADGDPDPTGNYFTSLNNLEPGANYYVRAFMINSDGFVSYGREIIFETDIE